MGRILYGQKDWKKPIYPPLPLKTNGEKVEDRRAVAVSDDNGLQRSRPSLSSDSSVTVQSPLTPVASVAGTPQVPYPARRNTNLVAYTTTTVYHHCFLHWIITCPVANPFYGFISCVMSKDYRGFWHLMPSVYVARGGDLVAICIERWKMPHVAASWGKDVVMPPPMDDHSVYSTGRFDYYATDRAGLILVAWRPFEEPANIWYNAYGVHIHAASCRPCYNELPR
jgi:hypothetical protein